jgi:hypothetical protein
VPRETGETCETPGREPYRRPVLRKLGSVRELTLGGTHGKAEGAGTFLPIM